MSKQETVDLIISEKPPKAEQLARFRLYANLTQKMLAEKSGVSVRMIEHYEQGKKDINHASAETIYKLSKALGCKMEELLNKDFHE